MAMTPRGLRRLDEGARLPERRRTAALARRDLETAVDVAAPVAIQRIIPSSS